MDGEDRQVLGKEVVVPGMVQSRGPLKKPVPSRPVPSRGINGTGRDRSG